MSQKKSKILYIGNKLSKRGNTITSIETLGNLLKQEGYSLKTASSVNNKIFRLIDMLRITFRLRHEVDVVIIDTYSTQNFYFAVLVAKVCRIFNLPYIPILRGGNLPHRLEKSKKLSDKLFHGAMTNVVPSAYLLERFKARGFNNLTYIPNTIQIEKYPLLLRKAIRPKLLWVRSFSEIYNPLLALQIVGQLVNEGTEVSMCMVGPDKDGSLDRCKKIAFDLNLPVTFTGKLEKEEWIKLSKEYDIFINTTNFDNMPVSVMEAMALGLPVISTNVGGVPFLIEHDKTGILVPPNRPDVFVEAIQELMEDSRKAAYLSKNARTEVENFDWKHIKHSWIKLLGN